MSGVGKGVASASLGALLQARGLTVTAVKIDPYINVDAGTMNPIEHGEVFVTRDGDETDQDIGNYERFLNTDITKTNYMTTGRVYLSVIERERALGYKGKTVEVVPHVPLEIIGRIRRAADEAKAHVTIVEIGGTVGEYQNVLYLEAARMMKYETPGDVLVGLVSYLPVPGAVGEMKSKPTQYAVRTLNGSGIQPDFIIGRSTHVIDEPRKEKIAVHCSVDPRDVISAPDVESIYDVPERFESEGLPKRVLEKLRLKAKAPDMSAWKQLSARIHQPKRTVRIGMIGKYFSTGDFVLSDAYLSVIEALKHACWDAQAKLELVWMNAEEFEQSKKTLTSLDKVDGILVPGGFGTRGVEGKISVIRYAREKGIPYLGICYGMQLAVVEFARHVAGLSKAHTTEVDPKTSHPIITCLEGQTDHITREKYGGTMRVGAFPCVLEKGSQAKALYKAERIEERHRHRYEVNPAYHEQLRSAGLRLSGVSPDGRLAEIIELPDHPYFVACQFHPEFQSRPFSPHPLFQGLIRAALKK